MYTNFFLHIELFLNFYFLVVFIYQKHIFELTTTVEIVYLKMYSRLSATVDVQSLATP